MRKEWWFFVLEEEISKCDNCNKAYRNLHSLYIHKKYDCGKEPKYKCTVEGCLYKSTRKSNLRQHVDRHTSATIFARFYECDYTNTEWVSTKKYNLLLYKSSCSFYRTPVYQFLYVCDFCNKTLSILNPQLII